jgi:hypothetical protein
MSEIVIRFSGVDVREGNTLALSLKEAIRTEAPDAKVQQKRENKENQDFGATLGIILAGPAIVAVARGVEQWLTRHHGVKLEITTPDGKVIAENVTAKNAVEIINSARGKS